MKPDIIDLRKLYKIAVIIDKVDEIEQMYQKFFRTAKRWKYRPTGKLSVMIKRSMVGLTFQIQIRNALMHLQLIIATPLAPDFPEGGTIVGPMNAKDASDALAFVMLNLKPKDEKIILSHPDLPFDINTNKGSEV